MVNRPVLLAGIKTLPLLGIAALMSLGCAGSDTGQTPADSTSFAGQQAPGMMSAAGAGGSTAGGGAFVGGAGTGAVAGMGVAGTRAIAGMSGTAGTSATAGSSGGTAGTGGAAGAGMAGAGGMGGVAGQAGGAATHDDLGKGDGKDVVTIGDSWMNLIIQGIEQSLDRASGQMYRHYAVPGTLVLNEQIPNQFKSAVAANANIKTVVMTGGGNDILTSACADAACNPIVDMVGARLTTLLSDMKTAGVQDVVIIGYTYPADMTKHASLDYSREVSAKTCLPTAMPRCYAVDSTKLQITLQDGIHPNAAGDDLVAKTVWELMQAQGMRR